MKITSLAEFETTEHFTLSISDNRQLYYVKELATSRSQWFSMREFQETPETLAKYDRANGIFHPSASLFNTGDGTRYIREVFPFTFWKVVQYYHIEEVVGREDPRVLDYLAYEGNMHNRFKTVT